MKNKAKKILSCIIAFACFWIPFSVSASSGYSNIDANIAFIDQNDDLDCLIFYISTPKSFESLKVIKYRDDISDEAKETYTRAADAVSTNNIRVAGATRKYNCHSYAWYSQNTNTNEYCMPSPKLYYTDGSYEKVEGTPKRGDIICYFDNRKDINESFEDWNMHSGIVIDVLSSPSNNLCGSSNTVLVISKWGSAGVYIHNGYECPYTSFYREETETDRIAEYVQYYRRTEHAHRYTSTQITDEKLLEKYHMSTCNCSQTIYVPHDWVETRINPSNMSSPMYLIGYRCRDCGYVVLYNPTI